MLPRCLVRHLGCVSAHFCKSWKALAAWVCPFAQLHLDTVGKDNRGGGRMEWWQLVPGGGMREHGLTREKTREREEGSRPTRYRRQEAETLGALCVLFSQTSSRSNFQPAEDLLNSARNHSEMEVRLKGKAMMLPSGLVFKSRC